ncbi:MAG: hypothetical protein JO295_07035 [Verrucomicrobia bacterium]|nr:hypothetical protein [Verrucomicrobiota bacterium]
MFKRLVDLLTFVLTVTRRDDEQDRRITALESEVHRLSRAVDLLLVELQHFHQREQDEREKITLRLQLALQAMEHRLPTAPPKKTMDLG